MMWLKKLFSRSDQNDSINRERLKEISYRGGVLKFTIPANWVEEYEEAGGGTFYEESPRSGTLRVNLLTLLAPETQTAFDVESETRRKALDRGGWAAPLNDGNALVCYDVESQENGDKLTIRYWEIYNPLVFPHLRIAIFSYTLLRSQLNEPKYIAELEFLDRAISNTKFAATVGS